MKICNPVTNGQDRDSRTLIVQLNEKLTSSGKKNVVHAFSLGCVISIVLIGLSLLVFYLFGMRSKVGIGLSAIIAMLLATMISRYLANHVCSNTITMANKVEVEQQILQNMDDHNHEPGAFQRIAEQILPSNAPYGLLSSYKLEDRSMRGVIYAQHKDQLNPSRGINL